MITYQGHQALSRTQSLDDPEKPPLARKIICRQAYPANHQLSAVGPNSKRTFLTNNAGKLLKTKDKCGRLDGEAGMFMKTKVLNL
jgi:hypothetical protein